MSKNRSVEIITERIEREMRVKAALLRCCVSLRSRSRISETRDDVL